MNIKLLNDTKVGIAENVLTDEECKILHDYAVATKLAESGAIDVEAYSSSTFMNLEEDKTYDLEKLTNFWGSKNVLTHDAPDHIRELISKLIDNSISPFADYLEAIDASTKGFTRDLITFSPIHVYASGHNFGHHVDCHEYALVFYVSDPSEFEGGELVYDAGPEITPSRGVLVIAPSDMPHEVLEVTSGYRCSLTAFFSTTED